MKEVIIEVAEIRIRITSNILGIVERFKEMYKNYLCLDSSGWFTTLQIRSDDMTKYLNRNLLPFKSSETAISTNYLYFASYDPKTKEAELVTNVENSYPCAEEYLLNLFSYLCLENKKLLFHCSFLFNNNDGYVFFGPSGIGKSTIARNSPHYNVLSDDIVIFEKASGNCLKVYKTPFERNKGKFEGSNLFNIKGFYRIHQSDVNILTKLNTSEFIANLLGNLWNVNFSKEGFEGYMDLIYKDFKNFPGFNLHVTNDGTFWRDLIKDV